MGKTAASVLSAGSDPDGFKLPFKKITIAFNNDASGIKGAKKWKKAWPEAEVMMPAAGGDWNDFLINNRIGPQKAFKEKENDFRFNGQLTLAKTAKEYAEKYYEYKDKSLGSFEFDGCNYYSMLKKGKDNEEVCTCFVGDFTVCVNHFTLDDSIPDRPEHSVNLTVTPKNKRKKTFTASAVELTTPGKQRELFFNRALSSYEGDYKASCAFGRRLLNHKAPIVRQLLTVGYDPKSNCYIYPHHCIGPSGEQFEPEKGMFKISPREYLRPANINMVKPQKGVKPSKVYNLIARAWPFLGPAALSWLVGSWFVHLIKAILNFYPFISFFGDTQCGKTILTTKLNAIQGFDEEGLPMSKTNTAKGEIRKLARLSSMAKALLEAQGKDRGRFDFDTMLSLYNSNTLQVRAVKNYGLETDDLPFLGALIFVQNREPFVTRQQKERVVSLKFKQAFLNEDTTAAMNELQRIPLGQLARFMSVVLHHRKEFEDSWHDEFLNAVALLGPEVENPRIAENYALVLAFHRILCRLIGVNDPLDEFLISAAEEKVTACESDEAPVATEFLTTIMDMATDGDIGFGDVYTIKDGDLYLMPALALSLLQEKNLMGQISMKDLLEQLKCHPAFISSKKSYRYTERGVRNSWQFDTEKI